MASNSVASKLNELQSTSSSNRAEDYDTVLETICSSSGDQANNLVAYVGCITSDNIGVINSRPLLASFVQRFSRLEDNEVKIEAGNQIVDIIAPKLVSYEQQDNALKLALAQAYEDAQDFTSSAKVLQTITLESSQRAISDDEKAKTWMRICRCYLEEEDPTNALTYLNKTKQVVHSITDKETRVHFHICQARISDSQRNFLDASVAYLQLSNDLSIDEGERLRTLSAAITCAVLAPAGPQRGKQLAKLYKDERAVETAEFGILEKIFLDRLLTPAEVEKFASGLSEHQLAKTSDGSTVLDKAVLEHNVQAVSRIYANITFLNLGVLLGVDADRAEMYVSGMIESKRLSGSIDQIDGIVHFNTKEQPSIKLDLRAWDANVQGLAEEVEKVTTMLQREEPNWYEQQVSA